MGYRTADGFVATKSDSPLWPRARLRPFRRAVVAVSLLGLLALLGCSSAPGKDGPADLGGGPGDPPDLLPAAPVTVTVAVDGMGRVTSMPAGIDCPGKCSARFAPSSKLMLTALPELRTAFLEWSGACAGGNTACVPQLGHDVMMTAHFGPRKCSTDNWCQEQPLPMEVSQLNKVWGSSASNVWAVGWNGVIVHYAGVRWYLVDAGTQADLVGLWGSSANDLWAVGGGQTALHGDGTTWGPTLPAALPTLFSLWGASKSDVWAFGAHPFAMPYFVHYDGTAWQKSTVTATGTSTVLGLWGSSGSDIWGVGSGGLLVHYHGGDWQSVTAVTKNSLNDIWGTSASDIWAVGDAGTLLHYDGATWMPVNSGTSVSLRGISGVPGSLSHIGCLIVGDNGTMLRYDGHAFVPMATDSMQPLRGVWVSDDKNAWAVGDGVILRYLP